MTISIEIAGRPIGSAYEPYIICELSGNHNGSLDRALKMLEAAAATGADAIKIQTYTPETITIDHDSQDFRIEGGLWDGRTLFDLYGEAHTPFDWHAPLFARAKELNITLFSSPFDETAVELLESLHAPAYKIASFELIDLPLVARVARTGKPMIMSTGMANEQEIAAAVETAQTNGCTDLALLHCVSSYPAPIAEANVRSVALLAERFSCVAGLSDHTPGTSASVAAIACGASIIEKHFTLARADGGPDAEFSMEPDEFAALVQDCKDAWRALGTASFDLRGSERGSLVFRRSLYAVTDIAEGEAFTPLNVRSIRPGYGLPPKHFQDVLGRKATRDLKRGDALSWDMISHNDP